MCADFAIHDPDGHNPHAHIMLTMRPLDVHGKWQGKTQKEYLCRKADEERGFTAQEFLQAKENGWEKQYMTEDEIAVMDGGKCILQLRGVRPFFSDKYDITKHPNYKYLSDYDKKNTFDMEKHLRRRPALVKPDEVFDYYEISESDLQEDTDHE